VLEIFGAVDKGHVECVAVSRGEAPENLSKIQLSTMKN